MSTLAPPPPTSPTPWKWTRDDLVRFHELGLFGDRRVMLIDGEVLVMSPMNEPHARAIVFVLQALQSVVTKVMRAGSAVCSILRHENYRLTRGVGAASAAGGAAGP